jgi:hypothetical protein
MYLNRKDFESDTLRADCVRDETCDYYDRGLACFSGTRRVDVVEAHMWFNLAAMSGDRRGVAARADLADGMTGREISEAQRGARLHHGRPPAA